MSARVIKQKIIARLQDLLHELNGQKEEVTGAASTMDRITTTLSRYNLKHIVSVTNLQ